jgi:hypothetical protein
MEATHGDVLLEMYGYTSLRRAAEVLARPDFSLLNSRNVGLD